MRDATDADFNKGSRLLSVKVEIYFDGADNTPFTAQKGDFLIDANWLEEGSADSSSLFGTISSNDISFRLLNKNGMFSPTNAASPYYGKMKQGVKIIPYIRPEYQTEEVAWVQMGVFYITGWTCEITGTYADVVANDIWYNIFKQPVPNYPVVLNKTYKQFLTSILTLLGFTATISDELDTNVPYCFLDGSIQQSLQDITAAGLAYVTSDKAGVPVIGALFGAKTTRATLTDGDQIVSVSAKQSITRSYDGVSLAYSIPQISAIQSLLEMSSLTVPTEGLTIENASFVTGPMWQVTTLHVFALSDDVSLTSYVATPWQMSFTLDNAGAQVTASLSVFGTQVELTEITISDNVTKSQSVSNKYIQDAAYAQKYKTALTAFVTSNTPVIVVTIKGNPLLAVGDKVVVQSVKYNLDFVGIIQRLSYDYVGSLSCEMTLLNATVLQGVT
ncbi:MAG: hypothetical protein RR382_00900 [Tannerellaceae bacterium]